MTNPLQTLKEARISGNALARRVLGEWAGKEMLLPVAALGTFLGSGATIATALDNYLGGAPYAPPTQGAGVALALIGAGALTTAALYGVDRLQKRIGESWDERAEYKRLVGDKNAINGLLWSPYKPQRK